MACLQVTTTFYLNIGQLQTLAMTQAKLLAELNLHYTILPLKSLKTNAYYSFSWWSSFGGIHNSGSWSTRIELLLCRRDPKPPSNSIRELKFSRADEVHWSIHSQLYAPKTIDTCIHVMREREREKSHLRGRHNYKREPSILFFIAMCITPNSCSWKTLLKRLARVLALAYLASPTCEVVRRRIPRSPLPFSNLFWIHFDDLIHPYIINFQLR